jgi:hypothetical protein
MILLRKAVDEKLQEVNLEFLHLTFNNNTLFLSGECGKNYITIRGVEVKNKLTNTEREYVITLVNNWIDNNVEKINRILELYNLTAVKYPEDSEISYYTVISGAPYLKYKGISFYPDKIYTHASSVKLSDMIYFINNLDKFKKLLKAYTKYVKEQEVYNKELRELNTCNI